MSHTQIANRSVLPAVTDDWAVSGCRETHTRLDEEWVGDGLGEGDFVGVFDGVGVGLLLVLLGLLLGLELLDELLVGLGLLLALGLLLGLLLALGLLLLVGLLLPEGLVRAVGAGLVPEAPSGTAFSASVRTFVAGWPRRAAVTVTGGLGFVFTTAAVVRAEQALALAAMAAAGLAGPVTIMPSKPDDPSASPATRLNMGVEFSIGGLMDASSPPRSMIPVVSARHALALHAWRAFPTVRVQHLGVGAVTLNPVLPA